MQKTNPTKSISYFSHLPFFSLLSVKRQKQLEEEWLSSGMQLPFKPIFNFCFLLSCLLSALFFFLLMFISSFAGAFAISLILFSIMLLAVFRLPSIFSSHYAKLIESDLPFALRAFAVYLKIKMPFEKALLEISKGSYTVSPIFAQAVRSIKGGASVQSALSEASSHVRSLAFSRAMHQMAISYEEGSQGDSLIALADELADMQLSLIREFGAKLSMGALLYMASSALLPAFFLIFSIGTAPIAETSIEPAFVWVFYLLLVPLVNLLVLFYLAFSFPPSMPKPVSKAEDLEIESLAKSFGFPLKSTTAIYVFSLIIGIAFSASLSFSPFGLLIGIAIALAPFFFIAYLRLKVASRIARIESEIVPALMGASSHTRFSLEKTLSLMASGGKGPLAEEMNSLSRQINAGAPVEDSINSLYQRTPSLLLRRTLSLLLMGYKTGVNMRNAIRQSADDILSLFSLVRERSSTLATARYTLIGASLLVPLILGTVLNFTSQLALSFSSLGTTGIFGSVQNLEQIAQAARPAAQIYLVTYSLMTASFLSMQEGRRERFFFYAALLTLISQGAWILITA